MADVMQRLLLIGHGAIAERYACIAARLTNVKVCGVVGRHPDKAQTFAERHGIPVWGTSIREVKARSQATAAIICTPNGVHVEGVLSAADAGLHCLCEKPLAIRPEDQTMMLAACRERGVKLTVAYMRRFSPHFRFLRSVMAEGRLGDIKVVDVMLKHYRPASYYNSWHGTKDIDGGGPFIQQGSHIIDLALWLCGGYDKVMRAITFRVLHDIETEDHGYAILNYRNGAIGMIEASTVCIGTGAESIEVVGTRGTIRADFNRIISCTVTGLEVEDFIKESAGTDHADSLLRELLLDFTAAIEEDREPFVTGESAAITTTCISDIYRKAGDPVDLG